MQADYVLDYDVVSTARAHNLYLMVRITGGSAAQSTDRLPLNLSVVLDKSGSMAGDKLDYVKKATQFLVQHLGSADLFSLVTYDTNVSVALPPTQVLYKDRIVQAVQAIQSGTSTNLSGGWLQGCQLVAQNQRERQVNRVLLLSDGLANVGITDTERLKALARQKRSEGVTTTTLGVGLRFNEQLMRDMAQEGGGAFYFIDNPDQAPHIFHEELQDLLSVVGQNLTVTLTPSADVQMVAQFNAYPTDEQGRVTSIRMGDLFADEIKLLLLQLSIPALSQLGQVVVARLRIEYDELLSDSVQHRVTEIPVVVNAVAENEYNVHTPDEEVMRTAFLLKAARAREEAVKEANTGNYARAKEILTDIAEEIEQSQMMPAVEDLQRQHDMLREEAVDYDLGSQRYDDYSRISSTTKAMYFSDMRPQRQAESYSLHGRMKQARQAVERNGEPPTTILWRSESRPLDSLPLKVGRAEDNSIVLSDTEISKYHFQIVRDGDTLYLEDAGSTNGTFANGGRVSGRFRLSVGDVVTAGNILFRFE